MQGNKRPGAIFTPISLNPASHSNRIWDPCVPASGSAARAAVSPGRLRTFLSLLPLFGFLASLDLLPEAERGGRPAHSAFLMDTRGVGGRKVAVPAHVGDALRQLSASPAAGERKAEPRPCLAAPFWGRVVLVYFVFFLLYGGRVLPAGLEMLN